MASKRWITPIFAINHHRYYWRLTFLPKRYSLGNWSVNPLPTASRSPTTSRRHHTASQHPRKFPRKTPKRSQNHTSTQGWPRYFRIRPPRYYWKFEANTFKLFHDRMWHARPWPSCPRDCVNLFFCKKDKLSNCVKKPNTVAGEVDFFFFQKWEISTNWH